MRLHLLLQFASYAMVFMENAVKVIYFCFGSLEIVPLVLQVPHSYGTFWLVFVELHYGTTKFDPTSSPSQLLNSSFSLVANERSNSDAITVPWTNSAQNTPSLSFNLRNGRKFLHILGDPSKLLFRVTSLHKQQTWERVLN